MHRAILEACLPGLLALLASFVLLWFVVRVSGGRWNLKRLRELHRCQDGGVQSLAFVVTLPLFMVIVQFIVQVSQLMVGVMVVNYSAYAAARSASVWVPVKLRSDDVQQNEWVMEDKTLDGPLPVGTEVELPQRGEKFEIIRRAAVLSCAPISPSRDLGFTLSGNQELSRSVPAMQRLYASIVPSSQNNPRVNDRLQNKVAYAFENTNVRVEYIVRNHTPSYKPPVPIRIEQPPGSGQYIWEKPWDEWEVDWQDPIRVTVEHDFALLPGPGRFLAKFIVRADGQEDTVSPRIDRRSQGGGVVYTTKMIASATITNDGWKSIAPYAQRENE